MSLAVPLTSATRAERVEAVLAELAAAYLDRMAAGDWTRASVVLQLFAATYTAEVETLRGYAVDQGNSAAIIVDSLQAHYDSTMRTALTYILYWAARDDATDAQLTTLRNAPQVAVSLGTWWTQIRGTLDPSALTWVPIVAATDPAQLPTVLQQQASGILGTNAATPVVPGGNITQLPGSVITPTTTSTPKMPLWAVGAIGIGVLAVAGFVAWGVISNKPAKRRRRKRSR